MGGSDELPFGDVFPCPCHAGNSIPLTPWPARDVIFRNLHPGRWLYSQGSARVNRTKVGHEHG
jgi:hypothetical protein